jgi:hypothetical protein
MMACSALEDNPFPIADILPLSPKFETITPVLWQKMGASGKIVLAAWPTSLRASMK